jgi:hypothetical protein
MYFGLDYQHAQVGNTPAHTPSRMPQNPYYFYLHQAIFYFTPLATFARRIAEDVPGHS